jgi:putative flavoprotein involved in K+ transport
MFARTAQPGLWFIAGSFAQCRIYSKYLGLQIKACEVGLLPRARAASDPSRNTHAAAASAS